MKTKNASDWNHTLVVIAWAAFLISFFLPSYAEGRGYQCAALHSFFWSGAMEGNWGSIHYLLLTLANLLMLISPFLLLRCREYGRCLSRLRYSAFAASILVWSFLILLLADAGGSDLRIGAYVWAGSFVLLWLSVVLPRSSTIESKPLQYGTLCT